MSAKQIDDILNPIESEQVVSKADDVDAAEESVSPTVTTKSDELDKGSDQAASAKPARTRSSNKSTSKSAPAVSVSAKDNSEEITKSDDADAEVEDSKVACKDEELPEIATEKGNTSETDEAVSHIPYKLTHYIMFYNVPRPNARVRRIGGTVILYPKVRGEYVAATYNLSGVGKLSGYVKLKDIPNRVLVELGVLPD